MLRNESTELYIFNCSHISCYSVCVAAEQCSVVKGIFRGWQAVGPVCMPA